MPGEQVSEHLCLDLDRVQRRRAALRMYRSAGDGGPGSPVAFGDNDLISWMQRGCTDSFDELYRRYRETAYRVARGVSLDHARAEEAVQEAFSLIWLARSTYRPERPTAAAWLLTVVRNRAIDATRRDAPYEAHRVCEAVLDHYAAPGDVAEEAVGQVSADELRVLIGRLPYAQREVIELAFDGSLSHTEIATLLNAPLGTIKARARRGLMALHRELESAARPTATMTPDALSERA